MIEKLRRKIILGNFGMVAVLLAIIFAALCMFNWQYSAREVRTVMEIVQRNWEKPHPSENEPGKEPSGPQGKGKHFLLATFVVTVDAQGQILDMDTDYMEITQEEAQTAVDTALRQNREKGTLWDSGLRYKVGRMIENRRTLVFADLEGQFINYTKLVGSMLVGFALALVGLWYISAWMAKQAVRPVEQAWISQRQFVADASHELKTPLTVILANAGILAEQQDATVGSQMKWVSNTMEEGRRMQKLVEDMLFLARSDDEGFCVEHQKLSLSDLVWSMELAFEAVAFEQGIALESEIAEDIYVSGDASQLSRLVSILLDNACKYTGAGGRVTLTLAHQRNQVYLTVQNTGAVIPQEQMKRLFERFYRADASRARSQGGYGLGLPIAETIVKAHGGSIRVESSEEKGTVFTVQFPACEHTS